MTRALFALVAGLSISPALYAMPVNYSIATDRTAIALSWRAFGHLSQAHLAGVTGDVTLDPQKDTNDRIAVKIPVATLDTANSLLTWQMKGGMFFDASRYPWIVFTSSRVVPQGQGHFRVFGSLSVKGIQRPAILDVTLKEHGNTPGSGEDLVLQASTAISRSAFNMGSFPALVDDRVAIDIQARVLQGR